MRLTRFDETGGYNSNMAQRASTDKRRIYERSSRAAQLPSLEPLRAGAPSDLVIAALLNNPPLDYFF
jgi:hypothetical protein